MIQIYSTLEAKQTILRRDLRGETPLPEALRAEMRRIFGADLTPKEAVAQILADVRARGDAAVCDWTRQIDGVELDGFAVQPGELDRALACLPRELAEALTFAAERIRAFHARQPLPSWATRDLGGELGQRLTPLDRVGLYVPGGSAPLPSSLLMAAIPAQVAGVREVVVASPPARGRRQVADVVLAAAKIAGVARVYCIGGAQAIAALAFGTQSIPRVDKIVGPGNLFVTLAKQQVFGWVGLDGLAGPTETVVVADETADPAWVAADLLAQAEHDRLATAILLTPSRPLAEAVQAEIGRQIESLSRAEVIAASLRERGGIVITRDVAEAVRLADEFAPEHLCLSLAEPDGWADAIRHAGGLFLGERSFEVLGDYLAGPSHIMPTGGSARYASPLTVLDFLRVTSVIALDAESAGRLSPAAARLAEAEGLDAHANAARMRAASDQGQGASGEARYAARATLKVLSAWSETSLRWEHLLRPDVAAMEAYQPVVPLDALAQRLGRPAAAIVKLDANENPYGPSPKALAALTSGGIHLYPDPDSRDLREALAEYLHLPVESLLVGAGADELIDLTLRAVITAGAGSVVVDCPPSFGMYPFSAAVNAARLLSIPRRADFGLDVPAIEAAVAAEPRAKVMFVCSPNNPDGSVISDADLRRLLALPLLVVLDEAYVEFHGESRIGWTRDYQNLVVLRTFSKWAGLAGLRVGYGAFPDWLAPHLWKIKQPYNVNVAAARAAIASLHDAEYLQANVNRLVAERERMVEALRKFDFLRPYPSRANFVLFRVAGRSAAGLRRALEAEGVIVRHFDRPRLRDHIRISVGKPEHTDALVRALSRIQESAFDAD